jgi:hypothetical protein
MKYVEYCPYCKTKVYIIPVYKADTVDWVCVECNNIIDTEHDEYENNDY